MLALSPMPETPSYPAAPRLAARAPALVRIDRGHPRRAAVEDFVRRVYGDRYGADVRQFAPVLVALHDDDGEIVAAAGYRPAARRRRCSWSATSSAPVETLLAHRPRPRRARAHRRGRVTWPRPGRARAGA